ncbi:MAG: hypothetical protein LBS42_06605 [Tannerella sp.]|jgi:hypothetical protein|nr:hypothetical protein [Tannerella sp.]
MKKRFLKVIVRNFAGFAGQVKVAVTGLLLVAGVAAIVTGCAGGGSRSVQEEKLEMTEPVKSFLKQVLPGNYSFYALKSQWPVSADDLQSNGIIIGSRVPDGLLPDNVIRPLYGGGFLSGTMVSLSGESDGVEKFGGIPLAIAIGISPEGIVNSVRKDGGKQIMLFSDDAAGNLSNDEIIKLTF